MRPPVMGNSPQSIPVTKSEGRKERGKNMVLKNIWSGRNEEGFFRKKVYLDREPESAFLRIFADTGYELFLNGRFVAGVDEWCNTRDYNVRLFLKAGENQIAVHGINHGGHRGMALELVADGETKAVTDSGWKAAQQEYWGWMLAEFEDSRWKPAGELELWAAGEPQWWTKPGSDPERVVPTLDCSQFFRGSIPKGCDSPYWRAEKVSREPDPHAVELLGREYAEFTRRSHLPDVQRGYVIQCTQGAAPREEGVEILETKRFTGPELMLDFQGETVGFFRMKVKSEQPVSFRLFYGETLDEACWEPSRDMGQNRMLHEEYRIFGGTQEFESRMRVAFRYVRVMFFDCPGRVSVSGFSARTTLYPVARRGYFACDDEEMTKLWEAGERTVHFCMQEYYLDAPKRDRFLWTGDARLEALVNYYTFGDSALFEFCWQELAKVQRPDGGIPSSLGEGCSVLWDYVAWYVIALYDSLLYTGNRDFCLKYRDSMDRAVAFLTARAGEDGLIDVPPNPLGESWMVELNAATGQDPYLNRLYLKCLKAAEEMAALARDDEARKRYGAMAERTVKSLRRLEEKADLTEIFDASMHTQIQYEVAARELERGNVGAMMDRIRKYWGSMLSSGSDCLHEGTVRTGVLPAICERHTDQPLYVSYCHGWSAAATVLLPMGIAGIRPRAPGFAEAQIRPALDVFSSFRCAVPTPLGEIAVKYEDFVFSWYAPENMKVKVIVGDKTVVGQQQGSIQVR